MSRKNLIDIKAAREGRTTEISSFDYNKSADFKSISKKLREELEEYPKRLQTFAKWIMEEYERLDPLEIMFTAAKGKVNRELAIQDMIEELTINGRDFKTLLIRIAEDMNKIRVPILKQILYDQALKGDQKAIDLFFRAEKVYGDEKGHDSQRILVPYEVPYRKFKDEV